MNYVDAHEKLQSIHQDHLLFHWNHLTTDQQRHLLGQIHKLDLKVFHLQQQILKHKHVEMPAFEPFTDYAHSGNKDRVRIGQELIAKGEAGCLIVAGGQGTRLRIDGPKGMFPVTLIHKKSLFELFAHKVIAAGRLAGRLLSVAIMTSPANHEQTIQFFEEHHYFGLKQEQLYFFQQGVLPLLDNAGNLFLETPWSISEGPDGNGSALSEFVHTQIWEKWKQKGIKYVNFIQIDNALADPFDAELIGYHQSKQSEITIKCVERKDPKESVGIIVAVNGKPQVIEYSEMDPKQKASPLHRCANISTFCLSMSFIKRIEGLQMPLHLAHKAVKALSKHGLTEQAAQPNAWKFEKFIFDILPLADKVNALLYPREYCFSPLKNLSGHDSLATVQESLLRRDRGVIAAITGKEAPQRHFELAQDFYYPTPELLRKWLGKDVPAKDYIEP